LGEVWRVILRYGYGINALRDDDGGRTASVCFIAQLWERRKYPE
jgi:hypothetical protein